MTPPGFVFNILLVAGDAGHEVQVVEAWREDGKESEDLFDYTLFHYNFDGSHDVLVVLDILDRIKAGFYHGVFIVPPAASWSRARHAEEGGQTPLRTRSQPFGVVHAASKSHARLQHENRALDFIHWFAEQTWRCEVMRIPLVLVFPEDFGGDAVSGPSPLWCMQELRDLEGLHEARRGAGFLCQLAGADLKRPLGIFSNLPALQRGLRLGWPHFSHDKGLLVYSGPLPRTCPCKSAHPRMLGISSGQVFNTSANACLGMPFWKRVFSAIRSPRYGWGKAQGRFCTLDQFLFLRLLVFLLLVFSLSRLGLWRALSGPTS